MRFSVDHIMADKSSRRRRRGFSLLEVMVALAILVVSLTLLMETQGSAAQITREAGRIITASDLAQYILNDALLILEEDGFSTDDVEEDGDFDDLGDGVMSLEFGNELDDYKWEYWISEVDIGLASDLASLAGDLSMSNSYGSDVGRGGDGGGSDPSSALSGFMNMGISSDMLTEMLSPYIREVRVRVWWGDDSDDAMLYGKEVIVTGHMINPTGQLIQPEGVNPETAR